MIFDTGQRERLPGTVAANLGRKPWVSVEEEIALVVDDPERTISKNHARLEQTQDETWITDLGSTNGTFLIREDGKSIELKPGVRTEVTDGTRVRIGQRSFTVSRIAEEDE